MCSTRQLQMRKRYARPAPARHRPGWCGRGGTAAFIGKTGAACRGCVRATASRSCACGRADESSACSKVGGWHGRHSGFFHTMIPTADLQFQLGVCFGIYPHKSCRASSGAVTARMFLSPAQPHNHARRLRRVLRSGVSQTSRLYLLIRCVCPQNPPSCLRAHPGKGALHTMALSLHSFLRACSMSSQHSACRTQTMSARFALLIVSADVLLVCRFTMPILSLA
jgi:hypothetical protein